MPKPPPRQQIYTIACRCGTQAAVHISGFNRPQTCRNCKADFIVTWRKDEKTRAWMPIVVKKAQTRVMRPKVVPKPAPPPPEGSLMTLKCLCGYSRKATVEEASRNSRCPGCGKWMVVEKPPTARRKAAPPALAVPGSMAMPVPPEFKRLSPTPPRNPTPSPVGSASPTVDCPCGTKIPLDALMSGATTACPSCGRKVRMERARNPQSMVMRMRPVFENEDVAPPPPAPGTKSRSRAKPAPEPEEDRGMFFVPEGEEPEVAAPPQGGQILICQCGEELLVSPEDLGKHLQCPSCTALLEIEGTKDPATGQVVLRAQVVGRLDSDPWSLEDFK
jgi:hypothetical protein